MAMAAIWLALLLKPFLLVTVDEIFVNSLLFFNNVSELLQFLLIVFCLGASSICLPAINGTPFIGSFFALTKVRDNNEDGGDNSGANDVPDWLPFIVLKIL